jgi:long-chain acyl-CoA synthetase
MELLVHGTLRLNAVKYPQKTAIVDGERSITYLQLNERANRLANVLAELGISKGDKVGILMYNCIEFIEAVFGVSRAGAVSVLMNYRSVGRELEYLINNSDTSILILGEEFGDVIKSVLPNCNLLTEEGCIVVGKKSSGQMRHYEDLLRGSFTREPEVAITETDPFVICYTSGTTGRPKGAVIRHRDRVLLYFCCAVEFGVSDEDVYLCFGPLYHHGPTNGATRTIWAGGKLVIMKTFDPKEALELIHREKVTVGFIVPTMSNFILNLPHEERAKYDVSSVRLFTSGGSPLHTKTKDGILKFFHNAKLHELLGATENGCITNLKHRDQYRKYRSVGLPFIGAEITLLDEGGKEVPQGEVGIIYSKSLTQCGEYYKMPEETNAAQRGEWFTVGDMGRQDEEGYFYVVDRKQDMIVSGGVNIYPAEIEEVLSSFSKVLEVACIGVPDEKWGEALKAVIVLKEGQAATEEEIIGFCEGKIAGYKKPKSVEFTDSLPKNPAGKILKRVIKEAYWTDETVKVA